MPLPIAVHRCELPPGKRHSKPLQVQVLTAQLATRQPMPQTHATDRRARKQIH
jgi:hypothetical protein